MLQTKLRFVAGRPHIWWGVSVEDRRYGLPRVEHLRGAPAAIRFLSIEPLLEDLGRVTLRGIDWVIVGGESGAGARPLDQAWVRSLRDQCANANVAFFFKQWGGVQKSKHGRQLDGQTYDEMPGPSRTGVPDHGERSRRLADAGEFAATWIRPDVPASRVHRGARGHAGILVSDR